MKFDLEKIFSNFDVGGSFVDAVPWGSGHINDTFLVTTEVSESDRRPTEEVHWILQRINHYVFKKPLELMDNAMRVCRHLIGKITESGGNPNRNTLHFIPTREGAPLHVDEAGNYWRVYGFIERVRGYNRVERPEIAYECGKAFGRFESRLADFDAASLHVTIDHFNDPGYLQQQLEEAVSEDPCDRVRLARRQIEVVRSHSEEMLRLSRLAESGELPIRVTHNDTKVNNVLIDTETDKAVCVIDLDTLMPGSALNDFGDSIRTATNTGEEDDADLSRVGIDLELFEAYTRGYLKYAKSFITPIELDNMAFSAKLYAYLIGLRFLIDFLTGDHYFKTAYDHHNLQRCKAQFKLLSNMEDNFIEMNLIVKRVYKEMLKSK